MSKRAFKAQASSSRAFGQAPATFSSSFGSTSAGFGAASSPLSYLGEQPDLSTVSDPNVIVNFKNLSKKDSITKAKALEEILSYVVAQIEKKQDIEDGFLDAWFKVYPRASIDVSRRVRQNAHTLHGQVCASRGKRIARYMPQVIGAWLAGIHDGDRSVTKSAQDALALVFATPEKRSGLSKAYQAPILEFCNNAILKESSQSLSDERTTTPEDSEAKYARVVASSIAVVTNLLSNLPDVEKEKQSTLYNELLGAQKLWDFSSMEDSLTRRALLRLLRVCLDKQKDLLVPYLDVIGAAILSKKTIGHQMGSSLDYSEALYALTASFPAVWSLNMKGKETASSRFQQLVKAGSQGAPAQFWENVPRLFSTMTAPDVPRDTEQATKYLKAIHTGITRKDEHRSVIDAAWNAYFVVGEQLVGYLPEDESSAFMSDMILPPVRQYIRPTPEYAQWTIQYGRGLSVISKALKNKNFLTAIEVEWPLLADKLIEDIQVSAPEQSKDYESSQQSVEAQGSRFFALQAMILGAAPSKTFVDSSFESAFRVLDVSINSLKNRHGKPYGAAGAVAAALREVGNSLFERSNSMESFNAFLTHQLPDLITTPSHTHLIKVLYASTASPSFDESWNLTIDVILNTPDSPEKTRILQQILSPGIVPQGFELATKNTELQASILRQAQRALNGDGSDWTSLSDAIGVSRIVAEPTTDEILEAMTKSLTIEDRASSALTGLEMVVKRNPQALNRFLRTSQGSELIQDLLLLAESPKEELAQTASQLDQALRSVVMQRDGDGSSSEALISVIERNLYTATAKSLPIDILVDLGRKVFQNAGDQRAIARQILPHSTDWETQLAKFLCITPSIVLSFTSSLGSAISLVDSDPQDAPEVGVDGRDSDSYTPALRMAQYSAHILTDNDVMKSLEPAEQADYYRLLLLTSQLANDKVTTFNSNRLWLTRDVGIESEMIDFISRVQGLCSNWYTDKESKFNSESLQSTSFVESALDKLFASSVGTSSQSFFFARAYSQANSEIIEINGWHGKADLDLEGRLKTLRKSSDVLKLAAFLNAFKVPLSSTQTLVRFCNELIADLTGLQLDQNSAKALRQLVFLNIILRDDEHIITTIAKQRMIFFVKHVAPWLRLGDAELLIQTETFKALTSLLPHMNDIYGDHWTSIIESLVALWSRPSGPATLPLSHASFKLFAALLTLTRDEDTSDDFTEAWQENLSELAKGLVNTLKHSGSLSDDGNQPLRIVNDLLARQLNRIPLDTLDNIEELFPLLTADSAPVQTTAFEILHRQIPNRQEQISLDVALEKTDAKLPEELLSLILEAPGVSNKPGQGFERAIPSNLRCYLSSWLLVFDHFKKASDKVKSDYVTHLKDGDYLATFLDFAFSFLGHSSGKPVDASKFEVTTYSFDIEQNPTKDAQWCLTYLIYLCLQRMPSVTKAWWLGCTSRQTVVNVESWTEKYMSPHIITETLNAVSTWAATQDTSSDEALIVKVNHRTKEVVASREIDEELMSMAIRLPVNFPLGQAVVEGLNRVAVDEKKWRSWLLSTQGVITFSNNSLVDGIIAFRKNIAGALKGQVECAICYSLVSPDKQLPTKKCGTCKNLFHGSCLFRWFKSSNSSSCPLCRNPFNYS